MESSAHSDEENGRAHAHASPPETKARLIARLLAGSWRAAPPAPSISLEELEACAPLLIVSGAAGLGWRLVRETDLSASPAALSLREAYRLHAIHAAVYEHELERAFELLRARGIEPLLIKGWSSALSYPERGLRPLGDMDLCVAPGQYCAALEALKALEDSVTPVDLHRGLKKLCACGWEELYERSRLVPLGDSYVRVLAPEDHLHILSVHMLAHGAWRPLWLCDIGAALESLPEGFDWELCLGKGARAGWVMCALGLARVLLGARIDDDALARRAATSLPGWLVPAVLKEWEAPFTPSYYQMPMAAWLRYRKGLRSALTSRWPNPIEATVSLRVPFNEWPRWPIQLGSGLLRTARFLTGLPRAVKEAGARPASFVLQPSSLTREPFEE